MNQLKKLILVQHCQSKHHLDSSVKNNEDKYNGLTATGQEQAKRVAEKIRFILSGKRKNIPSTITDHTGEVTDENSGRKRN